MRIALISDVHGSYSALVNVINDARANGVEKFVFIGDYIFDMPFSNEVTRLLMEMNGARIIKGNKEGYLTALANEDPTDWACDQMGGLYETYKRLQPEVLNFLTSLDDECLVKINPSASLYAVHYLKCFQSVPKTAANSATLHHRWRSGEPFSREQFRSKFTTLINSDGVKDFISRIDANIIVFGHTHMQCYGYCGDKLVINPGSCGVPLDFNPDAAYAIVEVTSGGFNVMERRVKYDIDYVTDCLKKSPLCEKSWIWCELTFLALKTGKDYYGFMFEIAGRIAATKNENGRFFSNSTWREAYEVFKDLYM